MTAALTPPLLRRTLTTAMPSWFDAAIAKVKELVADFRANEKSPSPIRWEKVAGGRMRGDSNGLAELRGLYGTGHGKHGKTSGLSPRHAKLAVGAAATLATFLFQTHMETKS